MMRSPVEAIAGGATDAATLLRRLEQRLALGATDRPFPGAAHNIGIVAEGRTMPTVQVGRLPDLWRAALVPAAQRALD